MYSTIPRKCPVCLNELESLRDNLAWTCVEDKLIILEATFLAAEELLEEQHYAEGFGTEVDERS